MMPPSTQRYLCLYRLPHSTLIICLVGSSAVLGLAGESNPSRASFTWVHSVQLAFHFMTDTCVNTWVPRSSIINEEQRRGRDASFNLYYDHSEQSVEQHEKLFVKYCDPKSDWKLSDVKCIIVIGYVAVMSQLYRSK